MTSRGPGGPPESLRLREVLDLLPDLVLLSPLRDGLLAASHRSEARRWSREGTYATLDGRLIEVDELGSVARSVGRDESDALSGLYRDLVAVARARAEGATGRVVELLLDAAEPFQERERHEEAAALLEVARREVAAVEDRALEAEIIRRLAKSRWRMGDLDRAADLYTRARDLFAQLGDPRRGVAVQGLGNVRAAQGRWAEAEEQHRSALERAGDDRLLTGQLFNNLSQVTRRQDRLDDAADWQARAEAIWEEVDSPADRVVALNNAGLLHLARGNVDQARESLIEGLGGSSSELQRAALLVNLAQVEARAGHASEAAGLAREAEELALLARATPLLIEAYTVLAVLYRDDPDRDCVPAFEKALELAADNRYPLERARAHVEYSRYRREVGDHEEARAHLERALEVYRSLRATREAEEVRAELEGGAPA